MVSSGAPANLTSANCSMKCSLPGRTRVCRGSPRSIFMRSCGYPANTLSSGEPTLETTHSRVLSSISPSPHFSSPFISHSMAWWAFM